MDFYQDVIVPGNRFFHLFQLKNFQRPVFCAYSCFHTISPGLISALQVLARSLEENVIIRLNIKLKKNSREYLSCHRVQAGSYSPTCPYLALIRVLTPGDETTASVPTGSRSVNRTRGRVRTTTPSQDAGIKIKVISHALLPKVPCFREPIRA
jgi:hypothetical protein